MRHLGPHELLSQRSTVELAAGLVRSEPVRYSKNGNRSSTPNRLIKNLRAILPRAGVYRVGDISDLAGSRYPVFQSCRPNCFYHTSTGQNTGAQGKGPSRSQALASCMMESLESFCQEPRSPYLIRASYDFLRDHRLTFDPRKFVPSLNQKDAVTTTEPLMWTPALHVGLNHEILIPAETVYFPFLPCNYHTTPHFNCSSNGASAGLTYLEAAIHGLYEVIERHYIHLYHEGLLAAEAIYEEELVHAGIQEVSACFRGEYELQIYSLEAPGIWNLPMILAVIAGDTDYFHGFGCSSTVDISIERAVSEALQSQATAISGAREDLLYKHEDDADKLFTKTPQPQRRSLRVRDYKKRVVNKTFRDLRHEYRFILDWLHDYGYSDVMIANLTRVGIDVPILKIVIPQLRSEMGVRQSFHDTDARLMPATYPNIEVRDASS